MIKNGDDIAVTVTKAWADAAGPISPLHYFCKEETSDARVFIAKLVSTTEPNGLWVKSAVQRGEDDPIFMFVPWSFVIAIRTSPSLQSEPEPQTPYTVGFVKST